MKILVRVVVGVLVCGLLVGAIAFWAVGREGENRIEEWIGAQITQIVNERINPVMTFDTIDYQSPDIVILNNLRVTADSDVGPIDLLNVAQATIRLAKIPRQGEPIVIQEIRLQKPMIRLIASEDDPTHFFGVSNFVKDDAGDRGEVTKRALSDVLQIRLIEIADGAIEYDPKVTDTQAMVLEDIDAKLDVTPETAGLYRIRTNLQRAPIFSLDVDGTLDADEARIVETTALLNVALNEAALSSLPPQLQKIITDHEVRGALSVNVIGGFALQDPMAGWFRSNVSLTDANATFGDWCVPISSANFKLRLEERVLHFNEGELAAFDGLTRFAGQMKLNEQYDLALAMTARKINLEKLMSSRASTQPTSLRGIVDANMTVDGPAKLIAQKVMKDEQSARTPLPGEWGSGQLELRKGRLIRIPFISRFNEAMVELASYVRLGSKDRTSSDESASIKFTMNRDEVRFSQLDYMGDMIAARGDGTIGLDQTLDLRFNAGPVEKLQSELGVVGELFGKLTDNLGSYRVTGTVDEPQFSVGIFR